MILVNYRIFLITFYSFHGWQAIKFYCGILSRCRNEVTEIFFQVFASIIHLFFFFFSSLDATVNRVWLRGLETRALCVMVKTPLLHWHPGLQSEVSLHRPCSQNPPGWARTQPAGCLCAAAPSFLPSSPPRPVVSSFKLPGTPPSDPATRTLNRALL